MERALSMIPPSDNTFLSYDYGEKIPQIVFPLQLILSHIRSVQLPQSKILCFQMLNQMYHYCTSDIKLERLVPYFLAIINEEENTIVRVHVYLIINNRQLNY